MSPEMIRVLDKSRWRVATRGWLFVFLHLMSPILVRNILICFCIFLWSFIGCKQVATSMISSNIKKTSEYFNKLQEIRDRGNAIISSVRSFANHDGGIYLCKLDGKQGNHYMPWFPASDLNYVYKEGFLHYHSDRGGHQGFQIEINPGYHTLVLRYVELKKIEQSELGRFRTISKYYHFHDDTLSFTAKPGNHYLVSGKLEKDKVKFTIIESPIADVNYRVRVY